MKKSFTWRPWYVSKQYHLISYVCNLNSLNEKIRTDERKYLLKFYFLVMRRSSTILNDYQPISLIMEIFSHGDHDTIQICILCSLQSTQILLNFKLSTMKSLQLFMRRLLEMDSNRYSLVNRFLTLPSILRCKISQTTKFSELQPKQLLSWTTFCNNTSTMPVRTSFVKANLIYTSPYCCGLCACGWVAIPSKNLDQDFHSFTCLLPTLFTSWPTDQPTDWRTDWLANCNKIIRWERKWRRPFIGDAEIGCRFSGLIT